MLTILIHISRVVPFVLWVCVSHYIINHSSRHHRRWPRRLSVARNSSHSAHHTGEVSRWRWSCRRLKLQLDSRLAPPRCKGESHCLASLLQLLEEDEDLLKLCLHFSARFLKLENRQELGMTRPHFSISTGGPFNGVLSFEKDTSIWNIGSLWQPPLWRSRRAPVKIFAWHRPIYSATDVQDPPVKSYDQIKFLADFPIVITM